MYVSHVSSSNNAVITQCTDFATVMFFVKAKHVNTLTVRTPLLYHLAKGFNDPSFQVHIFKPQKPCQNSNKLHVTVDTQLYIPAWRSYYGDSAVLLDKLSKIPLLWQNVCLHVNDSSATILPTISDIDGCSVVGLEACKQFIKNILV